MAAVWPDRVVDDANLAQNIAVVRKAIAALHGEPGSIETFPGRGYRILGPVRAKGEIPQASSANPLWLNKIVLAAAATLVLGLGSLAAWWSREPAAAPEELHRLPVTRLAGKEHQPAISPDGKAVAFVWDRPGETEPGIWVQYAGHDSPRRITPEGAAYASPAWSPDGRSLAADDTPSRQEAFAIYLISLDTGERRRLTSPEALIVGDLEPRFSPDGAAVTFIRMFHRAHQELFNVSLASGAVAQLTADRRRITGQDWLADGRTLVFSSDGGGEYRLWKREQSGAAGRGFGSPESTATFRFSFRPRVMFPRWSIRLCTRT